MRRSILALALCASTALHASPTIENELHDWDEDVSEVVEKNRKRSKRKWIIFGVAMGLVATAAGLAVASYYSGKAKGRRLTRQSESMMRSPELQTLMTTIRKHGADSDETRAAAAKLFGRDSSVFLEAAEALGRAGRGDQFPFTNGIYRLPGLRELNRDGFQAGEREATTRQGLAAVAQNSDVIGQMSGRMIVGF